MIPVNSIRRPAHIVQRKERTRRCWRVESSSLLDLQLACRRVGRIHWCRLGYCLAFSMLPFFLGDHNKWFSSFICMEHYGPRHEFVIAESIGAPFWITFVHSKDARELTRHASYIYTPPKNKIKLHRRDSWKNICMQGLYLPVWTVTPKAQ